MGEEKKVKIKKIDDKKEQKSRELTVRRESPFSLFQRMDRHFDELTRGFFNEWYWPFRFMKTRPLILKVMETEPFFRMPLANITENEKSFNIITELPGLEKENIEIVIHDGNLEIKGETKEKKEEEKEGQLVRREFRSANYYRCFSLPENIDDDGIEAELNNGTLNITIPKKEPEKIEKKIIKIK